MASKKQANSLRSQMEETFVRDEGKVVAPRAYNLETFNYFRRYLMIKAKSVLIFDTPEFWGLDQYIHFQDTIFRRGFIGYYDLPDFGEVALESDFAVDKKSNIMLNIFRSPKGLRITNKESLMLNGQINAMEVYTIGQDCGLIRLLPDVGYNDYMGYARGITDIIDYYAEKMALASQDLDATFLNSILAYVFSCEDEAMAETLKKMYSEILSGNPATFVGQMYDEQGHKLWETFQQNIGQNFIANEVLTALETLNDQFCTQVGIPNSNSRKESGISEAETNANNVETMTTADEMVDTFNKSIKDVARIFPNASLLRARKRYEDVKKEGENNDDVSNS